MAPRIVTVLANLVRHVPSFLGDRMVRSFYLTQEGHRDQVSNVNGLILGSRRLIYSLVIKPEIYSTNARQISPTVDYRPKPYHPEGIVLSNG